MRAACACRRVQPCCILRKTRADVLRLLVACRSCRTRLQKRLKLGKAVKSSKQKSTSSKHRKPDGDKLQQEERQLVSEAESSGCNTGCCLAQLGQQQHPAAAPRQSQLLQKQQMWQQQQWQQQRQQQGRRQDNAAQLSSTWDSRDAYGATTCHGSSSGTSWQSGSGAMPAWVAAAPCTVWRHDPAVGLLPPRCPSFTGGGSGGSSTCLDQQCSWWDAPEPQVQQAAALARIRGLPQQVPAPLWALPPHTPLGLSMQQQQTLLAAPHAHAPLEQPAQPPWVHPQPWSNGAVCMSPSSSVASTLTPAIDGAQHVQHVQQQRQSSCSVACGCCLPAAAPAAKFMAAERGCAPAAPGPSSTPGILQLLEQESTQLLAEYTDALHDVLACLGPDCAL